MSSLGWRLRIWFRRLIPHTPAKRWGYGAALCAAVAAAFLVGPTWPLCALVLLIGLRMLDVEVGRRRRGHMPTDTAYFFEGRDHRRRRS